MKENWVIRVTVKDGSVEKNGQTVDPKEQQNILKKWDDARTVDARFVDNETLLKFLQRKK